MDGEASSSMVAARARGSHVAVLVLMLISLVQIQVLWREQNELRVETSVNVHMQSTDTVGGLAALVWDGREDVPMFSEPAAFMNEKLFIWGARITRSYDEPKEAYLDVWLLGDLFRTTKPWYEIKRKNVNMSIVSGLLTTSEFIKLPFGCELADGFRVAGTHIVPRSGEIHAVEGYRMVRFDLSNHPSLGYLSHVNATMFVGVRGVVRFTIPRHSDSVGWAGPETPASLPPFKDRKLGNITLCLGGLSANGIDFVAEQIVHGIRTGIDRFILGLHANAETESKTPVQAWNVYTKAIAALRPLINTGVVSLFPLPLPTTVECRQRDAIKILFYQNCLLHAKGSSRYVANWDVDEYWMPPNYTFRNPPSTVSFLNQIESFYSPPPCKEWSALTFPSHWIFRSPHLSSLAPIDYVGRNFHTRHTDESFTNYGYRKTVARTKLVMSAGFHSFGTCQCSTIGPCKYCDDSMAAEACHFRAPEVGVMHHFMGLFPRLSSKMRNRTREFVAQYPQGHTIDEYSQYFRYHIKANVTASSAVDDTILKFDSHLRQILD